MDHWDGQTYRRVLALEDGDAVALAVTQVGTPAAAQLRVTLDDACLTPEMRVSRERSWRARWDRVLTRYRSTCDPVERSRWHFHWLLASGVTAAADGIRLRPLPTLSSVRPQGPVAPHTACGAGRVRRRGRPCCSAEQSARSNTRNSPSLRPQPSPSGRSSAARGSASAHVRSDQLHGNSGRGVRRR